MSGALAALVAPSTGRLSITLGVVSANTVGMAGGAVAIAMYGATVFYIDYFHSGGSSPLLRLQLNGSSLAQSFFRRVFVEDATPGSFQLFTSASATFTDVGGGVSQWTWTPSPFWSASDIDEVKRVIFYF